jgi:hypothetical protein
MPKNKVSEWSSTASNNTDISSINIAEGCAPSGINNAIRELMAQVKDMQTGADGDGFVVGGAFTCSGAAVFSSTVALGSSATATTQSAGDNSTKVATTAFVTTAVGGSTKLADPGGNGVVVRTSSGNTTNRTITAGSGISITNGDGVSGNPTITNSGVTSVDGSTGAVTVNVGAKIAALSYGAVGTYVLAYLAGGAGVDIFEGDTYAGSSLYPAGGHFGAASISADAGGSAFYSRGGTALSGTWRAMCRNAVANDYARLGLFLRIS